MSRISIPQIEAFYWVIELGSLQKAASRLSVTQSTISLRLRQLQEELPRAVLVPSGRGVKATHEGFALFEHAKGVLDAFHRLERMDAAPAIAGSLRIGLAEGFAVTCLAELISELSRRHPHLKPEWTIATSYLLQHSLLEGNLDLAVLVDPMGDRALRLVPLASQDNVWVAPHFMAVPKNATPEQLLPLSIITTPPPTPMYRKTLDWFAEDRQTPRNLCQCTSVNAAMQLVRAGIGIGIFPAPMVKVFDTAGRLKIVKTKRPLPRSRLYIGELGGGNRDKIEAAMDALNVISHRHYQAK
ncbi:LysR family transcriptional regulator [Acidisoma silvae]|uniref:LysR family transcriptional regulator n=1 Tax=Acidisoma silvae TaxID=2802396 RepID=A0A964E109_9PROT|nr:LysR family transcriptional regulator [Acidisoma silvae]MCB8878085.1 LysR family transcriptional regulator [Acidisoma silvae]